MFSPIGQGLYLIGIIVAYLTLFFGLIYIWFTLNYSNSKFSTSVLMFLTILAFLLLLVPFVVHAIL